MSISTSPLQALAKMTSTANKSFAVNRRRTIGLPYSQPLTQWFQALKIGQKIGYGYALALGVAAIGATVGGILGSHYQYEAALLEEHAQAEIKLIDDLQTSILQTHVHQVRLMSSIPKPYQFAAESAHLKLQTQLLRQNWDTVKTFAQQAQHFEADHHHQLVSLLQQYNGTIEAYIEQLTTLTHLLEQADPHTATTVAPNKLLLLQFAQHPAILQVMYVADNLSKILLSSQTEYEESAAHAKLAAQQQLQIILTVIVQGVVLTAGSNDGAGCPCRAARHTSTK